MYAGDFAQSVAKLESVLEANPDFYAVMACAALSATGLGAHDKAEQWYVALDTKFGPIEKAQARLGRADLASARGQYGDALALVEGAADTEPGSATAALAARQLILAAEAHMASGRSAEALAAAKAATRLSPTEAVSFAAARVSLQAGRADPALAVAADLEKRLVPELNALGLLLRAENELLHGRHARAVELLEEALSRADSWQGRLLLGRTHLAAGAYAEAHAELDTCMQRRGEAMAIFMDDLPTYRALPPVYFHLGKARDGMGRADAVEAYREFLELRTADGPMETEAKERVTAASP
jgi:tetratricopeptide (TPR) repeat protein